MFMQAQLSVEAQKRVSTMEMQEDVSYQGFVGNRTQVL